MSHTVTDQYVFQKKKNKKQKNTPIKSICFYYKNNVKC